MIVWKGDFKQRPEENEKGQDHISLEDCSKGELQERSPGSESVFHGSKEQSGVQYGRSWVTGGKLKGADVGVASTEFGFCTEWVRRSL